MRRIVFAPLRPRIATRSLTAIRLSAIPSRTARRTGLYGSTVARSTAARAGSVTGMPSSRTTSNGTRVRWMVIPGTLRAPRIGIVTSGSHVSSQAISRHRKQAERWLSAAPGPAALVAARKRPRSAEPACPQA